MAIATICEAIEKAPPGSVHVADFEISTEAVRSAIAAAKRAGHRTILDPSFADRVEQALLAQAYAIAPDAREAGELTGIKIRKVTDAAEVAVKLAGLGIELLCVKLSGGGSVVAHSGHVTLIEPIPMKVVDTTGAGDAYTGALAIALLERRGPLEAAIFATAAAHLAVRSLAPSKAIPTVKKSKR